MRSIDEAAVARMTEASSPAVALIVVAVVLCVMVAYGASGLLGWPTFRSQRLARACDAGICTAFSFVLVAGMLYLMFVLFMWGNGRLRVTAAEQGRLFTSRWASWPRQEDGRYLLNPREGRGGKMERDVAVLGR
jgi:hypothetical protein